MSRKPPSPPSEPSACLVVPLNDDAALYLALVDEITGAAVGLSAHGQALLRRGLVDRFGHLFAGRGDDAVDELIRLATLDRAA
ncbi:MAG: hypothetical protein OER95_09060 [Acidimicrobiia bacterium]|nr:hypothetical protein [Acidimicrobiia bacterium]